MDLERTPVLNLPLPHPDHLLSEDVLRLREAFTTHKSELVFLDFQIDATENVYPMVQGGKGLTEMILSAEDL